MITMSFKVRVFRVSLLASVLQMSGPSAYLNRTPD